MTECLKGAGKYQNLHTCKYTDGEHTVLDDGGFFLAGRGALENGFFALHVFLGLLLLLLVFADVCTTSALCKKEAVGHSSQLFYVRYACVYIEVYVSSRAKYAYILHR